MTPRELQWSEASDIEAISCGPLHTLFLTKKGHIYSCGNNDYGQLGHDLPRKRPRNKRVCTVYIPYLYYKPFFFFQSW